MAPAKRKKELWWPGTDGKRLSVRILKALPGIRNLVLRKKHCLHVRFGSKLIPAGRQNKAPTLTTEGGVGTGFAFSGFEKR